MTAAASRDYGIEYAKSGRAECRGCNNKILKVNVQTKSLKNNYEGYYFFM